MEMKTVPPFSTMDLQICTAQFIGGARWWEDADGNDWWSRRWRPEFNVLYYITKGGFALEMEGRRYELSAGQMVFIPAYTEVCFSLEGRQELEKYFTHFQLLIGRQMPTERFDFARVVSPTDAARVRQLFATLMRPTDPFGFADGGALLGLLGMFFDAAGARLQKNDSGLGAAMDYIHAHSTEDFSVAELAALCGYSKDHFTRKFKEAYGRTPRQYVAEYRLRRAKELLATTDRSVAAIAEGLGFRSAGYFTNFFCQRTGLSPTCYRKGCAE